MYNKENIFAKIIAGLLPADIVYQDEKILAFHDINPKAPVHILVIPKGEYIDYNDFIEKASENEISYFFKKIVQITKELNLNEGYRLITNKGSRAGQEVFHFHFHILGNK